MASANGRVDPEAAAALVKAATSRWLCSSILTGYIQNAFLFHLAETISQLFINLLKLVSLPIIFLSIVSTAAGMENLEQIKQLGQKVVKYTLLTTVLAASIALVLFISIDPVKNGISLADRTVSEAISQPSYLSFFIQIVPSNIIQPFNENNVIGVLFLAMLLSFAIISLPIQHRTVLHSFFSSIYAAIIAVTRWVVAVMPIAIWAFITLFMRDLNKGMNVKSLALYLTCVIAANIIQAFIVLPALLKIKKISPWHMAKGNVSCFISRFFY